MPTVENKAAETLCAVALRGLVAFPNMMLTLDVGRKKSVKALQCAMDSNQLVYLVTQKDITVNDPSAADLYEMGCVCRVRQVFKMGENVKVLCEGLYRAHHTEFIDMGSHFAAKISRISDEPIKNRPVYIESLIRKIKAEFEKYLMVNNTVSPEVALTAAGCEDLAYLCDFIAFNMPAPFDDKQYVLEQTAPVKRGKILLELLSKEREICEIDNKISEKTKLRLDDNQKDYYLREQMKIISDELYGDDSADEIDRYYERLEGLSAPASVKEKMRSEINKLAKMPQGSHEGTVSRGWLDLCFELPWNKYDNVLVDIKKAEKILDRDFYGMEKVKGRILEMLSVYALNPELTGQIICLSGPPGVGKTSIGKTIAECMGRPFARIPLGGMHDEAEIRGHRKTYIGSMPGRIITAIKNSGSSNPVILLDEIDKLGNDYKGDPASALLEVLDPEQNCRFFDNFLEVPYDLSRVVFITTANNIDTIPAPLLDRMELITLDGYTREEKFHIAKRHLLPHQLPRHALTNKSCRITDGALYGLIDFYTREAGVRKLERSIASLCSKAARRIASGESEKVVIKDTELEEMLGKHKYTPEEILPDDQVGIINGLAWTAVGGEIMQLEVAAFKGTGKIVLTGSLGDVMKESANAAVTFVRLNAQKYGIDPDFYKDTDIHIHATEAAVPKDGPSAGVTITTALVSALTGREIRRDIAMTGEVTIRGRVLKIGGLKEKSMAAFRGGVKTVFIPESNLPDLHEVDETVKQNVRFVPASFVGDIIDQALLPLAEEKGNEKYSPIESNVGKSGIRQ